ncbi:MAG: hypothetical protein VXZ99_17640, partial [Pseudomonadota bacterium]|nr:hypothetical protein [Pseudomonadota bacterium]
KRRAEAALFHPQCVTRAVLAVEDPELTDVFLIDVAGLTRVDKVDGVAAYCAEVTAYDLLSSLRIRLRDRASLGFR